MFAADHKEAVPGRGKSLLPRLEENERVLISAYDTIAGVVLRDRIVTPAAEWLIDNFHVVDEQLREIREDLPESYYRELPKLRKGDSHNIIESTRSRSSVIFTRTASRCRRSKALLPLLPSGLRPSRSARSGRLQLPAARASLRISDALLVRIVTARKSRGSRHSGRDLVLQKRELPSEQLTELLEKRLKSEADPAFVVQFTQRLRDQDPAVAVTLEWLDKQLASTGKSIEETVQIEHQRQAAAQVTVASVIMSMRLLSALDWKEFFESVSLIDPAGCDPAALFANGLATRDRFAT